MPVFNYGAGFQSNPLDAYNEMADIRHKSKLQKLLGDAYNAPVEQRQSALASLLAFDADAGRVVQSDFDARDKMESEKLGESGRLISGLYRNQNNAQAQTAYMNVRDALQRKLGFPLPQELDAGTADILGRLGSGGKAANPYDGLPADIQSLQLLQDNPQLAALDRERRQASGMVPKLVQTSQGIGWGTPGAGIDLAPLNGVAGRGNGANAPAGELFAALGQKYGIRPTSVQRSPSHNREVGGVPNSYHLSGQAADWQVPPQLKQQFVADAQANGFEAIDEGDHIHIEPAGRRGGQQTIAQPYVKPETITPYQQAQLDMQRERLAAPQASASKPLPVGALRSILEAQDALGAAQVTSDIIIKHSKRLIENKIPFGPIAAAKAKARTFADSATPEDVNFNEWEADKTRIVNESLRLNKGVQTEGDAQRAVNELMGANDRATAARALKRLAELNNRAVQLQQQKMRTIYQNYGRDANGEPLGQPQQPQRPAASGGWRIEVVN